MSSLVSKRTQQEIADYCKDPASVLLIVAPRGSGKREVAEEIIDGLMGKVLTSEKDQNTRIIDPETKSISIDEIRGIKSWVKLKHSSSAPFRIVVIYDSQRMTHEAQNALLKLLEDTPKQTIFIMTASNPAMLLDTVTSRSQVLNVNSPSLEEAVAHFDKYEPTDIKRAYAMCSGRVRLMEEVLSNPECEFVQIIKDAKILIAGSSFERLTKVDSIAKNYPLDMYLFGLKTIYKSLLTKTSSTSELEKRTKALEQIINSEELLFNTNPNTKLLLTNLCMNM